jgi:hypothetical protein
MYLRRAIWYGMTEATPLDDRGRVTILREYRGFVGPSVVQVLTPHGVLLRPAKGKVDPSKLPPALRATGEDEGLAEAA